MKILCVLLTIIMLTLGLCGCVKEEDTYIPRASRNPTQATTPSKSESEQSIKIMTLGDSITQLGTSDRGWVKYFLELTGSELVANTAVSGAWLRDKSNTVCDGNPVFDGPDNNANNTLSNQVQKIILQDYEAPDVIIIAIGTNDGIDITAEQMKAAYFMEDGSQRPLELVDRTTSAGAYRYCQDTLHELYPNANIFWCSPIMASNELRAPEFILNCAESLEIATAYTGQMMIPTHCCGINGLEEIPHDNGDYLIDGLHPNAAGAQKMGWFIASWIWPFLEMIG